METKKNKTRKTGRHEREREREGGGGLREGKDRGCGKGEKNVMLQLQFWVDSQKSRTESERRGETVAVIGAHGGRLRQGRG